LTDVIDAIAALDEQSAFAAEQLASQLALTLQPADDSLNQLWLSEQGLALNMPALGKPFCIDFSSGKYDHRRKFGGGRGQPLAKAVGLKQGQNPSVIDATAGFARDAFVLASLGCTVTMLEQNAIMAALLADALSRATQNADIADITARMQIHHSNAIAFLTENSITADVIYMDPMYPTREKSALVKKDMQLLHQLAGADTEGAELLAIARQKAGKRVVVKRPKGAEFVGEQKPSASIQSKNTRFDIYPTI
jgi:16S rRNA (guanine1516-N2)-methyltransferase